MRITLHCLGMPFNGETVNERSLGGSESACYYLARELASRGHKVTVFTTIGKDDGGVWEDVTYLSVGHTSNETPMGEDFEFYAQNTPMDVLVCQRSPVAFSKHYTAKLKYLWVHDLAVIRNRDPFKMNSQEITGMLCVSEFHKQQIVDTWDLAPEQAARIHVLHNAIDHEVFFPDRQEIEGKDGPALLYCSRPERGLANLVGEDGIMQRLHDAGSKARLFVCGYRHDVPELEEFYSGLRRRIQELPNVVDLGPLTKTQLAAAWNAADYWFYPTEFEEVSCITAMEAMATGTPAIASDAGALSETCSETEGTILVPLKDGAVDRDAFVEMVRSMPDDPAKSPAYGVQVEQQLAAGQAFTWARSVDELESVIEAELDANADTRKPAILRHLVRHSDIIAAEWFIDNVPAPGGHNRIYSDAKAEVRELYEFSHDEAAQRDHYASFYKERFYKNEWTPGEVERMEGHPRFEEVARLLEALPAGSAVLDWGCFHGHMTLDLAARFPELNFYGVDIAEEPITYARKEAEKRDLVGNTWFLTNEEFNAAQNGGGIQLPSFASVILAEVLEHVRDYVGFIEQMQSYGEPGMQFIITTPYGPWEWETFEHHAPYRFHLHHFEVADLYEMFGHHAHFNVLCIPAGFSKRLEPRGWYLTSFCTNPDKALCRTINYARKLRWTVPQETLSLHVLAKNSVGSIVRALDSVHDIVDEVVIGVDETSTDRTWSLVMAHVGDWKPGISNEVLHVPSPTEVGFDAARNAILERQHGDWILMLDSDEQFINGDCVPLHLKPNMWAGYAVPQHHYSVEPLGVISTDYPCRIFRNSPEIRYQGVVHEHPERGDNDGPGSVKQILGPHIAHTSYLTEEIRRTKFLRNVGLMARDRDRYPHRLLGKALWLRDLALMCRFEGEQNGGRITPAMRDRAHEGLRMWEDLLASDHPMTARLLRDAVEYYDTLTRILGGGFEFAFKLHGSKLNGGAQADAGPEVRAMFRSREDLDKVLTVLINEETRNYDSAYF